MSVNPSIKETIISKLTVAMSRGVIVLDENVQNLKPELQDKNIRIISVNPSTKDPKIITDILPNRIFITNNSKDFVQSAAEYDIGIIATEHVNKDPKALSAMISKALTSNSLWSKKHGWILILKSEGQHEFKELVD